MLAVRADEHEVTTLPDDRQVADVVIIGAGVAGMSAALALAPLRVHVVTKTRLGAGGSSPWAQGGVAAAVGPDDSPALHAADTIAVAGGPGRCRRGRAPHRARDRPRSPARRPRGARSIADDRQEFALGREAAHSRSPHPSCPRRHRRRAGARPDRRAPRPRRACASSRRPSPAISLVEEGRAAGCRGPQPRRPRSWSTCASAVVLATGGIGRVYSHTTNPPEATGDGLAMAAARRRPSRRPGVRAVPPHRARRGRRPHAAPHRGAARQGRRHRRRDGAPLPARRATRPPSSPPRDVVARGICAPSARRATRPSSTRARRSAPTSPGSFPPSSSCARSTASTRAASPCPWPRPRTTTWGAWSWTTAAARRCPASGPAARSRAPACTGPTAWPATRCSRRWSSEAAWPRTSGDALETGAASGRPRPSARPPPRPRALHSILFAPPRRPSGSGRSCGRSVGLLREEQGLASAVAEIGRWALALADERSEAASLVTAASLVAQAALARRESRGSHFRLDYPELDPRWQRRQVLIAPAAAAAR